MTLNQPAPRINDLVVGRMGARFRGRRFPCAIGRSGTTVRKIEGDGATPTGVFRFEFLYRRPDRASDLRCALPVVPIGPFDGWSDDPADPSYNTPIRRFHPWRHERLRRPDPLYDLILVFDANRSPITPGGGSALFVHIWKSPRKPTEGCVAFAREHLVWILERLDRRSRLVIQP